MIITLTATELYEVRPSIPKLCPEKKSDAPLDNGTIVVYLEVGARPDLTTAVPFLTTRVCGPTDDDWLKLRYVLEYLNGTKGMCLILQADKCKNHMFLINAACQVHADCKGNTVGSFTLC